MVANAQLQLKKLLTELTPEQVAQVHQELRRDKVREGQALRRQQAHAALQAFGDDMPTAALALGVSLKTLYRWTEDAQE